MLNTLSFDTKTLTNQDFPQNFYSSSIYLKNTPKTQDTWYNLSKKSGNLPFYIHNTDKSNKFTRENSK